MGSDFSTLSEKEQDTRKETRKTGKKTTLIPALNNGCKIAKPYRKGKGKRVSFADSPDPKDRRPIPMSNRHPIFFPNKVEKLILLNRQTTDLLFALEVAIICLTGLLIFLQMKGLIRTDQFITGLKTLFVTVFLLYNGYVYLFIPRRTYFFLIFGLLIGLIYGLFRKKQGNLSRTDQQPDVEPL
jgi:hypothetical protein